MKQKFDKWDRWLDTILNEVESLTLFRFVYQELQSIINSNKDNPEALGPLRFFVQFLFCVGGNGRKTPCEIPKG